MFSRGKLREQREQNDQPSAPANTLCGLNAQLFSDGSIPCGLNIQLFSDGHTLQGLNDQLLARVNIHRGLNDQPLGGAGAGSGLFLPRECRTRTMEKSEGNVLSACGSRRKSQRPVVATSS